MNPKASPSKNSLLKLMIGMSIVVILILGLVLSISVDGVPYTFERTVEFQEETEIYVDEYPYLEEFRITANDSNTENISFVLFGWGGDFGIEKEYDLIPGESVSSISDWELNNIVFLVFSNASSNQKMHFYVIGRSNNLEELLEGISGFPSFDSLGYFFYIFLPSIVISLIIFFFLLFSNLYIPPHSNEEERKVDRIILAQIILPISFLILYLIISQILDLISIISLPTVLYFYYCLDVFIPTLQAKPSPSSNWRIRTFMATFSFLLILAPFFIFIGPGVDIHIALKYLGLIALFATIFFFNSFLIKLNFQYSFWIILGSTLLISSVFFLILYSPLTFTVMNGQKVWNSLPILPINTSIMISGIILMIYGYFRSSRLNPQS